MLFKQGKHIIKMYDDYDYIFYDYEFHLKYGNNYKLSNSENIEGLEFLNSIGFPKKPKLVLLTSRDSKYLESIFPNQDYKFNNFRDAEINTFKEGVNFLLNRGFHVIRMGSITKEKLKIKSENFFDYSFYKEKSEFLDFYLFSKCSFVISVSTGLDELAKLFNKPICYVNLAPIGFYRKNWRSLNIAKKIYDKKSGKILPYSYLFSKKLEYCSSEETFNLYDIGFIDNTSEEILYCIKEFIENILNKDYVEFNESETQKKFKKLFYGEFDNSFNRGYISEEFIKKNLILFANNN